MKIKINDKNNLKARYPKKKRIDMIKENNEKEKKKK